MNARLGKFDLLDRILAAVEASGWNSLVLEAAHPFLLRFFGNDDANFLNVRVYIWNCTHGGKRRPSDEYRVQITGVVPNLGTGEHSLLLGWHESYGVFVGFDIREHVGQASASPSIQVKEFALLRAHTHAFSAYERANEEIAICFRPEFLVEYVLNLENLHGITSEDRETLNALNAIDETDERESGAGMESSQRREIISSIKRKYREHDFRRRVLSAYAATCAFCGVQLRLVEAAHIIPVASESSTDETANGVALCALHHKAYDQNLLSFDEEYRIQVSSTTVSGLKRLNLSGGWMHFQNGLKNAILLPADKRDYPSKRYISESRKIRRWRL
jgi:putative restriction endonuclease